MSIKQLQRVALDVNYKPYRRPIIVPEPAKPGIGYYVSVASMLIIVFSVVFMLT